MKYLSLFSGIGGFELGIQNAFKRKNQKAICVGYSEIDKHAIQIYQSHFSGHKNYGDVTSISEKELPDFELLVGGFPCQPFSIAGNRKGFADTRGTAFFDIARIVKQKQPRLLLLENVKGLLYHEGGKTFGTILSALDELGYDIQWQVLNSSSWVPQNRERVFIIGHHRKISRPQVFPIGSHSRADIIVPTLTARYWGAQANGGYISEKPSPNGKRKLRRLTPLECERLQGFPDGWTKCVKDAQRYECLGNAVTVNVIESVVKKLYKS